MADNLDLDKFENEGGPVAADKETPEEAAPAPSGNTVVLVLGPQAYGPFVVSHLGFPDVTAEGAEYTREQADEVLTLAMICGVQVVERKN